VNILFHLYSLQILFYRFLRVFQFFFLLRFGVPLFAISY
jgi:hypothetical protein